MGVLFPTRKLPVAALESPCVKYPVPWSRVWVSGCANTVKPRSPRLCTCMLHSNASVGEWERSDRCARAPVSFSPSLPVPFGSPSGGLRGARRHARHDPAHARGVASGRVSPLPSANLCADDDKPGENYDAAQCDGAPSDNMKPGLRHVQRTAAPFVA